MSDGQKLKDCVAVYKETKENCDDKVNKASERRHKALQEQKEKQHPQH